MKYIVFALLVIAAFFGNLAQASFECYLEIQGIQGESTAEGHTNDITIQTFTFDVSRPASGGASQRSDLILTKLLDKASPVLALRCADGTSFQDVTLTCRSSAPGRPIFYKITLFDVFVTRVAVAGSTADNRPGESVSFRYNRIRWEYWPILPDGTQGPLVRHGWDFLGQRPF